MNEIFKIFKLIWHNFIYFLILGIGYEVISIGSIQYNLFGHSHRFVKFVILTVIILFLTYYFLKKTLKNKKIAIILLLILLLSIVFCISPILRQEGLIPNIFGRKIHFFFYDFAPTWVYFNQLLYLISHIYQNKNNIKRKKSENNFDKFLKQHCEKLESFDISIVKEYCHKNIDNFNYVLNENKEYMNLKMLGELNADFFKYYLSVDSDDFSFSLDKINKDKYPDREIIHVGYMGHSRLICLPNRDSLYDDENPYENLDEPGFYTSIYMFVFAEILVLKYKRLDKYIEYDEFIKNEISNN